MNVKKGWLEKVKKPYLLAIPSFIATVLSSYSVVRNLGVASYQDTNNLARLPLTFSSGNIHGKTISDSDKKKLLDGDRERLTSYYRSYNPENINVSYENSKQDSSSVTNLFIHSVGKFKNENPNNFWFDNVKLNQLNIDRYGYEYDDSGNKKSNSSPELHSIVKWSDIDVDNVYRSDEYKILSSFSFRFFNQDIPKSEVDILSYEKDDKYKLEDSDFDVSRNWFVWIDKDILSIKLNYALQTYVFNQSGAQNETAIKGIIGDASNALNTSNDNQKKKKELSTKNYESLPEEYKTFAKDYIQTFIDTSATDTSANWSNVVNHVTARDSFIKSKDLNKIYNRFKKQSKSLELFKPHLITKITAGATGNWKISLNLLKDDENLREYESRAITKKTSSSEAEAEKKKNSISLFRDPDTNREVNMNEIFDLVSKHSVRYFSISGDTEKISSAYSSDDGDGKEILHVLSFKHNNEFGIYSNQQWIPFIMAAIFLLGILVYLIVSFKSPGAIMGFSTIVTTVNVAGSFFALGSQLSLMGVFAFFIGILYSLFIGYYLLSFLKKVFSIEFLDSSNVWSVFKRGLVTVTDISLPCFIFSSFLVFFSPDKFREFGIVMSMFVLFSYVFISVIGCLMSLNRACRNIVNLSYAFNLQQDSEDCYFKLCNAICSKKLFLRTSLFVFPLLIISGIVVFLLIGFNSFSLLKENFLVIADKGSESSIIGKKISTAGESAVYLTRENPSTLNGNSTVMSTRSFGDFFTISDLLSAISFSYAPISFYVLVRFKLKGIFMLLLNTVFPFLLFISAIVLFRIPISSAIFLSFCVFLSLSIVYNTSFLSLEGQNKISWYAPFISDIKSKMFKQIKWSIIWCVLVLAISCITSFWTVALYFGASVIFVHLLSIFFHQFLSSWMCRFSGIYLEKYSVAREEGLNYRLDPSEEEVIEGINKNKQE